MKKICYLMHVDWNWIKQRPHFLGELLSKTNEVDVFFVRNYRNLRKNTKNKVTNFKSISPIKKIPLSSRCNGLKFLEKIINLSTLQKIYNGHYDIIWISSPIILDFINIKRLSKSQIIYDCMDDVSAFYNEREKREFYLNKEKELIKNVDIIFTSSVNLKEKMVERGATVPIYTVNNAISKSLIPMQSDKSEIKTGQNNKVFNLVYFGMISTWFDFDILLSILSNHSDVKIILAGPTEVKIPKHQSIEYIGVVNHSDISELSKMADAFIMPFVINELIQSVDPVKVYEYIAFQRPSIIKKYKETQKFSGLVNLYDDITTLDELINDLKIGKLRPPSYESIIHFLNKNNWDSRVEEISRIIR